MGAVRTTLVFCGLSLVLGLALGGPSQSVVDTLNKVAKSYTAACWYESLTPGATQNCAGDVAGGAKQQKTDKEALFAFGYFMKQGNFQKLPSEYGKNCQKFADKPDLKPEADESAALKDGSDSYSYKGFAHCMIQTLRQRKGDSAVQLVADDVLSENVDWRKAFLHRNNVWRERHGVAPFQLDSELSASAQAYAEDHASKCFVWHSARRNRLYRNQTTGENYARVGNNGDLNAVLKVSNDWYAEAAKYPFPSSCEKTPLCKFADIGAFTQTVWKGTTKVGYGYAPGKCGDGRLVARYFPAGNVPNQQAANVFPAKS